MQGDWRTSTPRGPCSTIQDLARIRVPRFRGARHPHSDPQQNLAGFRALPITSQSHPCTNTGKGAHWQGSAECGDHCVPLHVAALLCSVSAASAQGPPSQHGNPSPLARSDRVASVAACAAPARSWPNIAACAMSPAVGRPLPLTPSAVLPTSGDGDLALAGAELGSVPDVLNWAENVI